jgi:hypothetical protein
LRLELRLLLGKMSVYPLPYSIGMFEVCSGLCKKHTCPLGPHRLSGKLL